MSTKKKSLVRATTGAMKTTARTWDEAFDELLPPKTRTLLRRKAKSYGIEPKTMLARIVASAQRLENNAPRKSPLDAIATLLATASCAFVREQAKKRNVEPGVVLDALVRSAVSSS